MMRPATRNATRPATGTGNGTGAAAVTLPAFVLGETYADNPGTLCTVPIPAAAAAAGINSAMHPSVVYFPNGKSGYKYWMAHSPFKSGIAQHENPNIVASNDGVTWAVPAGATNPIAPLPAGAAYQNDPNLYWDAIDQQFILTWGRVFAANVAQILGMTSPDGLAWSAEFVLNEKNYTAESWGSTAIMRRADGSWMLMAVNNVPATSTIIYATAAATAFAGGEWTGTWSATETCTLDNVITEPWHMDVRRYGAGYVMLLDAADSFNRHQLVFLTSSDGAAWSVDRNNPLAIGWNGDPAFGSHYYKAGFVLGPWFGAGKIGRMWYTNSTMAWMRVADLAAPPASQLGSDYLTAAIDGGGTAPYTIADAFDQADGALHGAAADHGGNWVCTGGMAVEAHKAKWGGGASVAYLSLAANNGVVGMRVAVFPYGGTFSLAARLDKIATPNNYQLVLNYTGSLWRIMVWSGSAWEFLATWAPPAVGDGSYHGTEVIMSFAGAIVKAYLNGRLMAAVTLTETQVANLASNTEVAFSIGDAATRIDRFFAHA